MSKNKKRNLQKQQTNHSQSQPTQIVRQTTEQFSGPIPPPATLEHYDRILPGAAERILAMAENNSNHAQLIDRQIIEASIKGQRRGQLFGFSIAVIALACSAFCAYIGAEKAAMTIGGTTVVSLVGAFLYAQLKK